MPPSDAPGPTRGILKGLRSTIVWRLLREQRGWVVLLCIAGAGSFGVTIGISSAIRDAIDKAIVTHEHPLGTYIPPLFFLPVAGVFVGFTLRQTASRIGFEIEYQIRVRLYERLQALNPRQLDEVATGQLVTRAVTDLSFLEAFAVLVPLLIVTFIVLSAIAVVIIIQSIPMAILALAAVPVNIWIVMRFRPRLLGLSWMALHRRAEVTTTIDEAVRGVRVVKAFGREDRERGRVRQTATHAYAVAMNRIRALALLDLLVHVFPTIISALVIVVAGRLIGGSNFTIGRLLVLLYFATALTQFAERFGEIADAWQFARAGALRLTELMDLLPPPTTTDARPLPPVSSGLRLDDVSFTAHDDTLLEGIDLVVGPGELVVLHGSPGSGKSLTAAIAAGRTQPTTGTVHLDGVDLRELDPLDVVRAVRVMTEEPFLFGRSVRENLEMAVPAVDLDTLTEERLWAALEVAAADAFVRDLPDGLDAVLGDRGMTLSGGQRQRLSLAQALLEHPRVLVLDDALSAVNPALEFDIVRRIRRFTPQTAILCITRREGLEGIADRVLDLPPMVDRGPRHEAEHTTSAAGDDPMLGVAMAVMSQMSGEQLTAAFASLPPEDDEPDITEEQATVADEKPTVVRVVRPILRTTVLAAMILFAFSVVSLIPPGIYKVATDDFDKRTHHTADIAALVLIVVLAAAALANYSFRLVSGRVVQDIMYMLRRRIFQRLSFLGIDYYDRELPGRVAARVVYDLDRISDFLEKGLYDISVSTSIIVMAMAAILVWSPPVAAVVLPFVPLMFLLSLAQIPVADRAYDRQRATLGAVVERFQEDMAGRYVIDAFGSRDRARDEFRTRARGLRSARRWSQGVSNAFLELMNMFGLLAGGALIWKAGGLALAGKISVGSMIALEVYLLTALGPIALYSLALQRLMAARASFRTLRQPFGAPILPVERPATSACPALVGHLALDHVRFAYPGTDRIVLDDVSLELLPGTSLALVGPTGAGKSSIAKLAARIYDPVDGAVQVDGSDLRDLELLSFRRRLGIVPQDAFCFRGTVGDNIAYGAPDANAEELSAAVAAVGGEGVLASLRMSTTVEEEGRNLTAAQRQIIALARAVLTRPDVLILDEATSSLDPDTEAAVLDSIRRMERTTIFITHRLPVARTADRVAVVDGGRIVEHGTHEQLTEMAGAYAALWALGPEIETDVVAVDPISGDGLAPV